VDGVLAVDPFALQGLLAVTGPVTVDGGTVDTDSVVADLLHDQYQVFLDGTDAAAQAARRDRLGAVVAAVLDRLLDARGLDRGSLDQLTEVTRGRHLLAWSPDESVSGALPDDALLLSVVNRGGNKLDWFLDVEASLTVARGPDPAAGSVAELHVLVGNRVDSRKEPTYVAGPYPGSGLARGEHLGVVVLTVPGWAEDLEVLGADPLVRGADGAHRAIGVPVRVPAGERAEVVFRFTLPAGASTLEVQPSARARPTRWAFAGKKWEDAVARRLTWQP
jgi:hypothetical protein